MQVVSHQISDWDLVPVPSPSNFLRLGLSPFLVIRLNAKQEEVAVSSSLSWCSFLDADLRLGFNGPRSSTQ